MKTPIILIIAAIFSLASCSSTQVTSSWKAPNVSTKHFKNVVVLGIMNEKDRSLRQQLENQLVSDLKAQGYNATSALESFGPKAFNRLDEDKISDELKNSGYDAVLTTSILDKSKEQNYTPSRLSYEPVGVYYNRFRRYYTTVYDRVYTPGYYTNSTNFFLESNLYDVDSGDLLYSVQSKSFDPSSASTLSYDYSKAIVKDMKKMGIIEKL